MRYFSKYRFCVGRKIEFKDLFTSIDAYLKGKGLQYRSMGYCLQDLGNSCYKLTQKMHQYTPMELIQGHYSTWSRLTNLFGNGTCEEEAIRCVGSKIPRPYNFSEANIYYRDVAFFKKQAADDVAVVYGHNKDLRLFGSYIQIQRGFEGPKSTTVVMSIELTDAESVKGADVYAADLATHLGNVKYISGTEVYLDAEENAMLCRANEYALPFVKSVHDELHFRAERVREEMLRKFPKVEHKQFNARLILQRAAPKYGFDQVHSVPGFETYFYKKVRGGIYLSVQLMSGNGMEMGLVLTGPGFSHRIVNLSGHPENSREATFFTDQMLALADSFEKEYMDAIVSQYPQYPDWCPFLEE